MLVMVTGGKGRGGNLDSVELLNMDGSWNCPMPPLPEPRMGHTQTGLVTCGASMRERAGGYSAATKSCVTFASGNVNWEKTHTLAQCGRGDHSAWASPQGVMMLGGEGRALKTSEILLENGDTKPGFSLDYKT